MPVREHLRALPSFYTTNGYIPVLTQQRDDVEALADDATHRGWDSETERHLKLINRVNDLITSTATRGQATVTEVTKNTEWQRN
jgi:hypothetical protein